MSTWRTISPVPLAWRQLTEHRLRFAIAALGVTFAVVLVLMQLGFQDALYTSAVQLHRGMAADVFLISPEYQYLGLSRPFSRRRLDQARAHPAVASATSVSFDLAPWRNPTTGHAHAIFVVGVDPGAAALRLPGLDENLYRTRLPDTLLFDTLSRPEFGVVPAALHADQPLSTELARRRVVVRGSFALGTGFAVDGTVIASRETFLRLFPHRRDGSIDIGLLRLRPGADADTVRAELASALPSDVEVLTKAGLIAREQAHWRKTTPIGYVFGFGVTMGLVVGAVIVYLVLFVNVAERLAEFATLKALGFADGALFAVVLQQAIILAICGFAPGVLSGHVLYAMAARATNLPMQLTAAKAVVVFVLTCVMCAVSGAAALRKVRAADPAEVFA